MSRSVAVVCPDVLPMLLESAVAPYREPAVQCLHLVEELHARGWQLAFLTTVSGSRDAHVLPSRLGPAHVLGTDVAEGWWARRRRARRLHRALRQLPGDVVLRWDAPFPPAPAPAWPVPRPHVHLLTGERAPRRRRFAAAASLARGAAQLWVPSVGFGARLGRAQRRAAVLPPGFPLPEAPGTRRRGIAWVGPLDPDSGADVLLDLADAFPSTRFTMCAQPGAEPLYAARVAQRARALGNVRLQDDAAYADVLQQLGSARLFVSTARNCDLTARTVLAWQRGAVVVSLVSDPDGLLREHKVGLRCRDPHTLFEAVRRGLEDDATCAELRARARRFAEERFDVQRVATHCERLLETLLAS